MQNKIKKYRFAMNFSQQNLADLCGVSRETICRIEANKTNPSLELAYRISRYLHAPMEDLFTFDEEPMLQ
ncbi:MAG TPA: helix-turn-helix transcriptional regulator [Bacillales bacterium]|nr:helix-turn-helix transcriptional regulator [Bacillales bacterium]